MHLDSPHPTLRAIVWKHPKRTYPRVIEMALARLAAALDNPKSGLFKTLFDGAPVPGKTRERRKRSDGATNVLAMLSTLMASADIGRGLVATPSNGVWERKTWYSLDTLAFGRLVQGERSMRRTERAGAELVAQGFLRSVPWRVTTDAGIRSLPGLKFVTDKLWKALGLWNELCTERKRRDRQKGELAKAALKSSIGGLAKPVFFNKKVIRPISQAPTVRPPVINKPPPSQAGPKPSGAGAAAAFEELKKFFSQ